MCAIILQKFCYLNCQLNSLHNQGSNTYPNHNNTPLHTYVSDFGDFPPTHHSTFVSCFHEGQPLKINALFVTLFYYSNIKL